MCQLRAVLPHFTALIVTPSRRAGAVELLKTLLVALPTSTGPRSSSAPPLALRSASPALYASPMLKSLLRSFDIKSLNVLCSNHFRAKIADVGLAQAIVKGTHLSLQSLKGTQTLADKMYIGMAQQLFAAPDGTVEACRACSASSVYQLQNRRQALIAQQCSLHKQLVIWHSHAHT